MKSTYGILSKISCITLSVAIAITSISSLAFTETNNTVSQSIIDEDTRALLVEYVIVNIDGTISLDISALDTGINQDTYKSIVNNMENVNDLITTGYMQANQDGSIEFTEKTIESLGNKAIVEGNQITTMAQARSGGIDYFKMNWDGSFVLFLSDRTCNMITRGGSIAVAVCTFVPEPLISKVVSAIVAVGSYALANANKNGRGIVIIFNGATTYQPQ